MFSIDEFNSSINRTGGVARKSQYLAVIIPPATLDLEGMDLNSNHFALRMNTFEFPSRSIVPIEYRDYGPVRPIGGQANFTEVTGTVIMSADLREREFFMRWQDLIAGGHRNPNKNSVQTRTQFDVGYFDEYKSNGVEIRQYDQTSKSLEDYTYRVQLVDAFPQLVGNMDAGWESGDEVQQMNVTFSYRHFVEEFRLLPAGEVRPRSAFREFFNTEFGRVIQTDLPLHQRASFIFLDSVTRSWG